MSEMIKNKDAIEFLKELPDNSGKLIVTSPPYNMNLRIMNGKYCSRQIVKELTKKYSLYDDNLPIDKYYQLMYELIKESIRVAEYSFINIQFLTGNKRAWFKIIGSFSDNLKEIIIWDKMNAEPSISENVLNSRFEAILVFSKEEDAISRKFRNVNFEKGALENLWQIKRGKKIHKEHGAVFPEKLIENIVLKFSDENDTIIDPFMGTGTTGVICKRYNRNFIGCDLVKEYCEFAKERIKDTTKAIF